MAVAPPLVHSLTVGSTARLDHAALPSVTALLATDETGTPVQPLAFQRLPVGTQVTVLCDVEPGGDGLSVVVRVLEGEHSGEIYQVSRRNARPV
jgi:hypothetical protein